MKTYSDNCVICSKEFDVHELKSLVVTASYYKICNNCLALSSPLDNYIQVKNIIYGYLKFSQQINDPELSSPDIKIEPADSLIQKAVALLKQVNPNYFVGVRKIVLDTTGSGFGHVASGKGQDPSIIHIDLPKIKSEIQSKLGNLSKEEQEKELVRQIALAISHEKGHISSFKEDKGFEGAEQPAQTEELAMSKKIDDFYNATKSQ